MRSATNSREGKSNGEANNDFPESEEPDSIVRRLPESIIDRLRDVTTTDRSRALFSVIKKLIEQLRSRRSGNRAHHPSKSERCRLEIRWSERSQHRNRQSSRKTAAGRKLSGKAAKFDQPVNADDMASEIARSQRELDQLVNYFNRRYSVVNEAGKVSVFEWRLDPVLKRDVLDRISHSDFRRLYENDRLRVFTKDGPKIISTTKNRAEWWLTHPPVDNILTVSPSTPRGGRRRDT